MNICGILIFKIAIIPFLWEFVFLISIRVNFCDCVMWIISFHGITLDYFVASVRVFIHQPDVPLCLLDRMLHHLGILLFIDDFITG